MGAEQSALDTGEPLIQDSNEAETEVEVVSKADDNVKLERQHQLQEQKPIRSVVDEPSQVSTSTTSLLFSYVPLIES